MLKCSYTHTGTKDCQLKKTIVNSIMISPKQLYCGILDIYQLLHVEEILLFSTKQLYSGILDIYQTAVCRRDSSFIFFA